MLTTVEDERRAALKRVDFSSCASDGAVDGRLASGVAVHSQCTAVATHDGFSQHVREACAVLTCVLQRGTSA